MPTAQFQVQASAFASPAKPFTLSHCFLQKLQQHVPGCDRTTQDKGRLVACAAVPREGMLALQSHHQQLTVTARKRWELNAPKDTLYIHIKAQIYAFGGLVWASEAWATFLHLSQAQNSTFLWMQFDREVGKQLKMLKYDTVPLLRESLQKI